MRGGALSTSLQSMRKDILLRSCTVENSLSRRWNYCAIRICLVFGLVEVVEKIPKACSQPSAICSCSHTLTLAKSYRYIEYHGMTTRFTLLKQSVAPAARQPQPNPPQHRAEDRPSRPALQVHTQEHGRSRKSPGRQGYSIVAQCRPQ
jgi:hypothetical protein